MVDLDLYSLGQTDTMTPFSLAFIRDLANLSSTWQEKNFPEQTTTLRTLGPW